MSRTEKDKPSRVLHEPWDKDRFLVENRTDECFHKYNYLWTKTTKTKKRKEKDTEWHWMSTPSAWTRLMMNKPQRRENHLWEKKALISDIEELDHPNVSRKPHVYYW